MDQPTNLVPSMTVRLSLVGQVPLSLFCSVPDHTTLEVADRCFKTCTDLLPTYYLYVYYKTK